MQNIRVSTPRKEYLLQVENLAIQRVLAFIKREPTEEENGFTPTPDNIPWLDSNENKIELIKNLWQWIDESDKQYLLRPD
jgi:hypothetical protein